jgi:hypothetical protein
MSIHAIETRSVRGDSRGPCQVAAEVEASAQSFLRTVESAGREIGGLLRERMERKPYGTLGVAFGLGYVLGGGVPSRLTGTLVLAAARIALVAAVRGVVDEFVAPR